MGELSVDLIECHFVFENYNTNRHSKPLVTKDLKSLCCMSFLVRYISERMLSLIMAWVHYLCTQLACLDKYWGRGGEKEVYGVVRIQNHRQNGWMRDILEFNPQFESQQDAGG